MSSDKEAVKPPVKIWFDVKFVRFAYVHRGKFYPARWMKWSVQAIDSREALKLAKQRYRRAEQFSVVE